jgi:hypothetical protein
MLTPQRLFSKGTQGLVTRFYKGKPTCPENPDNVLHYLDVYAVICNVGRWHSVLLQYRASKLAVWGGMVRVKITDDSDSSTGADTTLEGWSATCPLWLRDEWFIGVTDGQGRTTHEGLSVRDFYIRASSDLYNQIEYAGSTPGKGVEWSILHTLGMTLEQRIDKIREDFRALTQ